MADLRFCDYCESILDFQNSESGQVEMICSYCERIASHDDSLQVKIIGRKTSNRYSKMVNHMEYDQTLRQTSYFECPNSECKSHDGDNIPWAGMFNYYNNNRQLALCCKYCGNISLMTKDN